MARTGEIGVVASKSPPSMTAIWKIPYCPLATIGGVLLTLTFTVGNGAVGPYVVPVSSGSALKVILIRVLLNTRNSTVCPTPGTAYEGLVMELELVVYEYLFEGAICEPKRDKL